MADRITARAEDFGQWYVDVILNSKLADYSPVKGCMVIRPNGYAIWEKIRNILDTEFSRTGHQNAYFPLFIPESFLNKEAEHVEGFAPECAVVTHGGGKKLDEPLIVRPTSETIINAMFTKWIQSYRDLPLKINQWANVVRWELRTKLFLRTTEFLWQEGHTCHETEFEAREEALTMLEVYKNFAENYLAIPVIHGKKTDSERFAGAVDTYSIEMLMQDGRALQGGTTHFLGQNFAKAFNTKFQTRSGSEEYIWQTSWGVSTRLIGALVMAHSDDKGLVLPPKLAPKQCVIIPIFKKGCYSAKLLEVLNKIKNNLEGKVSIFIDDSEHHSPGFKFHQYEVEGIPLRVEMGFRELDEGTVVIARRDTGEKQKVNLAKVEEAVIKLLDEIQKNLFNKAKEFVYNNTSVIDDYEIFKNTIDGKMGMYLLHWCGSSDCEAKIKEETKATIRCLSFNSKEENGSCIYCGKNSDHRVHFARAH